MFPPRRVSIIVLWPTAFSIETADFIASTAGMTYGFYPISKGSVVASIINQV